MKIAVTYDNGNVFQHFGRTEQFKVYDVENGHVVSSEVTGSDGAGHEALADILADKGIDVLICGGLGEGAQIALADAGIEVCSGASGNTDEAVEAYLKGELISTGANCDHHDEEHGEDGCGGECGGGCHGCHGHSPITGKNVGKTVKVNYKGTFDDGRVFDSSYDRGTTLDFVCGAGQMIRGFDQAVANMEVGETVNVHLMPEEAYGMPDPRMVFTVDVKTMPGSEDLKLGDRVYLQSTMGQPIPVTVTARYDNMITFDANHEMAGKELNFMIELVEAN